MYIGQPLSIWFGDVPYRYPMPPPQLPAKTPRLDVAQPFAPILTPPPGQTVACLSIRLSLSLRTDILSRAQTCSNRVGVNWRLLSCIACSAGGARELMSINLQPTCVQQTEKTKHTKRATQQPEEAHKQPEIKKRDCERNALSIYHCVDIKGSITSPPL